MEYQTDERINEHPNVEIVKLLQQYILATRAINDPSQERDIKKYFLISSSDADTF